MLSKKLPVEPAAGGFRIAGVAFVDASPFRSIRAARAIAERIAGDVTYLAAANALRVAGIRDLRGLLPMPAVLNPNR